MADIKKIKSLLPINLSTSLQTTRWKSILDQSIKQGNELSTNVNNLNQEVNTLNQTVNNLSVTPSGSVVMFAGSGVPSGWLVCDGSVVSQTTYANLYSAIGTTYNTGGEGAGNFRLPNTSGIFVRGVGQQNISGTNFPPTAATLGQKQDDATAKNGLTATDSGHSHTVQVGSGLFGGINPGSTGGSVGTSSGTANITVNSTDAETRPACIAFYYIIKT